MTKVFRQFQLPGELYDRCFKGPLPADVRGEFTASLALPFHIVSCIASTERAVRWARGLLRDSMYHDSNDQTDESAYRAALGALADFERPTLSVKEHPGMPPDTVLFVSKNDCAALTGLNGEPGDIRWTAQITAPATPPEPVTLQPSREAYDRMLMGKG